MRKRTVRHVFFCEIGSVHPLVSPQTKQLIATISVPPHCGACTDQPMLIDAWPCSVEICQASARSGPNLAKPDPNQANFDPDSLVPGNNPPCMAILGQTWAILRPSLAIIWLSSDANVPNSVEVGPNSANVGRSPSVKNGSNSVEVGTNLAHIDPNVVTSRFGRWWPKFGRSRPKLVNFGPSVAQVGQVWPDFAWSRPKFNVFGPDSVKVCRLRQIWARFRRTGLDPQFAWAFSKHADHRVCCVAQ